MRELEGGRRETVGDGRRQTDVDGVTQPKHEPHTKMWGKIHEQITRNKKQSTQIMKTITNRPKPNLYSTPKKKIA